MLKETDSLKKKILIMAEILELMKQSNKFNNKWFKNQVLQERTLLVLI